MIEFRAVSYRYPGAAQPVLSDVSFTIAEGEFVLVAGASGSGKSTLLRAINGLVPHFYGGAWGGSVTVAGRDTRQHEPRQLADVVGLVFQDPEAQLVADIVEDELVFGMENLGVDPRIMRRRVEEVLDQLAIAHLRRRRLTTLSGGERQRVAIAAVLTMQPAVLVLDEPTSQLDPHAAEEVITALQQLNADLGLTVVLSEHRLERVVQHVDRVLFAPVDAPGAWQLGAPAAVLETAPFAPPLAQFGRAAGWAPLPLTVKAARQQVRAAGWDLPLSSAAPTPPAPAPSVAAPALHVARLSATVDGRPVLNNVSLSVAPGSIVALMGRNGAGKTTLLRAIMGLIPSSGTITVNDQPLNPLPTERRARLVGYVPQDPRALLFQETVSDELRWTLAQHRVAAAAQPALIAATLDLLDLTALAARYPRDLSSGEQQRVALAALLVVNPPVLLLDEPTRGMDYRNKARLVAGLRRMTAQGHAVLLVTHDVELVASCATELVLLSGGEVVTAGPPAVLLNESLLFSSQIGKLFRHRPWLTADEALAGLRAAGQLAAAAPGDML